MLFVEVKQDAAGISTVFANGISVFSTVHHDDAIRFARGYLQDRGGGQLEYDNGLRMIRESVRSKSHERKIDVGTTGQHPAVAGG